MTSAYSDDDLHLTEGRVAVVEIRRAPDNFFDMSLIERLVKVLDGLAQDGTCRAVVLCSDGKHFCAGANFSSPETRLSGGDRHLYDVAAELFDQPLPIVAAVQGGAIGGGLGLALAADFRVATPESRFAASFSRLGFHQGFAISVTLPAVVGQQAALELLVTGRRIKGEDAYRIGLVDRLVPVPDLRRTAMEFAEEIAAAAPLAVRSIRATMRRDLVPAARAVMDREKAEQQWLMQTQDWAEGIRASAERREPRFIGK